jgi:hypothetical protein
MTENEANSEKKLMKQYYPLKSSCRNNPEYKGAYLLIKITWLKI